MPSPSGLMIVWPLLSCGIFMHAQQLNISLLHIDRTEWCWSAQLTLLPGFLLFFFSLCTLQCPSFCRVCCVLFVAVRNWLGDSVEGFQEEVFFLHVPELSPSWPDFRSHCFNSLSLSCYDSVSTHNVTQSWLMQFSILFVEKVFICLFSNLNLGNKNVLLVGHSLFTRHDFQRPSRRTGTSVGRCSCTIQSRNPNRWTKAYAWMWSRSVDAAASPPSLSNAMLWCCAGPRCQLGIVR